MLYKLTILLFGLLCFSCNNDENAGPKSKNVWTQKNDFGGGVRSRMISFSVNGKGYAGLGLGEDETGLHTFNDFWEYSPESDQWVQKKDLPQWVLGMVGLSIGNKGYLLTFGSTLLEYDPVADTWTERAPFPFSRAGQCGFVINGKIYAGTGYDPSKTNEIFNDWWEYDPATDEWTQKADVPSPGRAESAAWATADKGFLGSGYYNGGVYNDFWEYDPVADNGQVERCRELILIGELHSSLMIGRFLVIQFVTMYTGAIYFSMIHLPTHGSKKRYLNLVSAWKQLRLQSAMQPML